MGYVYAFMWICTAIILLTKFRKESKAIIPLGIYFVFLGIWQLINDLCNGIFTTGGYIWVLRAVSALVLALCAVILVKERNKSSSQNSSKNE